MYNSFNCSILSKYPQTEDFITNLINISCFFITYSRLNTMTIAHSGPPRLMKGKEVSLTERPGQMLAIEWTLLQKASKGKVVGVKLPTD